MEDKIAELEELVQIQCSDGNWNYDPYMHGLANGMILMLATLKDEEPEFLAAPDEWLNSKKSDDSEQSE